MPKGRLRQRLGAARSGRQNSYRGIMTKRLDQRDVGSQFAIEEGEQIDADTHKQGADR